MSKGKVPAPPGKKFVQQASIEEIQEYESRGFAERKVTKVVAEFYKVKVSYGTDGQIDTHYYPYDNGAAYKVRTLPKTFHWVGKSQGLFGRELFPAGGKRVILCEGEIDTMSVAVASYEKYDRFYPVVGLSSSVMSKHLLAEREWLRSFKEVVLCFDMDKAGNDATNEAVKIIGADKCKIVQLPLNDANEVLKTEGGSNALMQCIFEAKAWAPAGIISKEDIWKQMQERNRIHATPYPPCMAGLNTKLKGRRKGEIALFISGTGSGKSTIIREIIVDAIETTDEKIGVISLEESPGETGMKLSGMAIERNPANEEIDEADLRVGFDRMFGDDRLVVLDHQGSIKDESIVDQLEYMCLMGCTTLLIDHITILVSEGADGLSGNEAIDKIMNDLLRLVKRHNVWIGLVSHLRKVQTGGKSFEEGRLPTMDDIRGSGSIKQVSFDIIAFSRNMMAEIENERNTILMGVLKSRTMGQTGIVQGSTYNQETGRLSLAEIPDEDEFTKIN